MCEACKNLPAGWTCDVCGRRNATFTKEDLERKDTTETKAIRDGFARAISEANLRRQEIIDAMEEHE